MCSEVGCRAEAVVQAVKDDAFLCVEHARVRLVYGKDVAFRPVLNSPTLPADLCKALQRTPKDVWTRRRHQLPYMDYIQKRMRDVRPTVQRLASEYPRDKMTAILMTTLSQVALGFRNPLGFLNDFHGELRRNMPAVLPGRSAPPAVPPAHVVESEETCEGVTA